jgi:hypothetical protein
MIDPMNHRNTSPTCWPRTTPAKPTVTDVLEELRQLRASVAVYRKIVERLMKGNRVA